MSPRSWNVRAVALLSAGALAVHELRYALVYGDGSGHALAAQGHAYLAALTPLVIAAVVLALGARVRTGAGGAPALSFGRAWAAGAAVLAGVHFAQESLEGVLAPGHPSALLAHGGAIALLLCVAVGALVALALRGADATADALRPAGRRLTLALPRPPAGLVLAGDSVCARTVALGAVAGRGPPVA